MIVPIQIPPWGQRSRRGLAFCILASLLAAEPSGWADAVVSTCSPADLEEALAEGGLVKYAGACSLTLTNPITIWNEVTLDATGFTNSISAAQSNRLFVVEAGADFTLVNLRLSGGKAPSGGAIFVKPGGRLTLSNCVFQGNAAIGAAGLAGAAGADLPGTGGHGTSGTAGQLGQGGAIYNGGVVQALRCQFLTNSATGGHGGKGGNGGSGTYQGGNGGAGGNGAPALGGAIYNGGALWLQDCSLEGNSLTGGNGGAGGTAGTGPFAGLAGTGGAAGSTFGAAVYSSQSATVVGCTFSANTATGGNGAAGGTYYDGNGSPGANGGDADGGGLCLAGAAGVTNCTFQGNRLNGGAGGKGGDARFQAGNGGYGGNGRGGALYSVGTTYVVNCTVAQNTGKGGTNGVAGTGSYAGTSGSPGQIFGAGLTRVNGSLILQNTIVSANSPGGNLNGTIIDQGYNISSDGSVLLSASTSRMATDPRLGTFANHGGPTKTYALQATSPALNKIPESRLPWTDQRGARRPIDELGEIGAYESGYRVAGTVTSGSTGLPGVTVSAGANSTVTSAQGQYELFVGGGSISVVPQLDGYVFNPTSRTVTVTANTSGINFNALRLYEVSGTVIEFINPVSNIVVQVGTNLVTTDSTGTFRAALTAGTYAVTPVTGCYLFNPPSRTVTVGPDTNGVNFIAARQVLSVGGRITTPDGAGLGGVTVKVGTNTVQTGADGVYRLDNLCGASYPVIPSLPGYGFSPASRTITVPPDNTSIDFVGATVHNVAGRVTLGDIGMTNVMMMLGTNSVATDTNGAFVFTNVMAANYTLAAVSTCYNFSPVTTNFDLGSNMNIEFIGARDNFVISGAVMSGDVGRAGVPVKIGTATVTTDANGAFALSNLCAGTYTVKPTLAGFIMEPAEMAVTVGPSTNGVSFEAVELFSIAGRATAGTNPLASFRVQYGTNVVFGTNGAYQITGLRAGNYELTASADCYQFNPPVLDVPLGPTRTNADFAATRYNLAVAGRIVGPAGKGIPGVAVTVGTTTLGTDNQGNFVVPNLCPGTNVVTPSLPGTEFEPARLVLVLETNDVSDLAFTGYPTFTVSGRVLEGTNGIGHVLLSAVGTMDTGTVATATSGTYSIPGLRSTLTYTLTPTLPGFAFVPETQSITVESNLTNVDFKALPYFGLAKTSNSLMQVTVPNTNSGRYRVEASTNLSDWLSISTNTAPFQYVDPRSTNSPGFYRVRRF